MVTCWELSEIAVSAGASRVLIHGAVGLAKSRWAQDTLSKSHKKVSQCTLNEDIAVQELLGHYIPKGTEFSWHDGPVMKSYRGGHGLVVNEIGRASGAVHDMFLAVLDDPSVSMIALANGEDVKPGEKFQVICTSNASPEAMDEALRDRFDAIIHIDRPHPDLIKHLNDKRDSLGTVVARSFQDNKSTISPRRALAFIAFIEKGVPEPAAATLAFGELHKDILVALKAIPASAKK